MSIHNHKLPAELVPQSDICVPLHIPAHPDYVALLVRAIRVLTLDRHYERDENFSAQVVRRQWLERTLDPLIEALVESEDCVDCEEGDCEAYDNSASFINYSPQNPFSEPDLVPNGYLTPPFTRFAEFPIVGWLSQWLPDFTEELTGYLPNDVIVDISSIPSGSWSEPALGMPQIAIDVSGNGVVELHMLNFPLGGRAIVTIDSQPNLGDIFGGIIGNSEFIVELNRDLLSVPPENVAVTIYEIEIDDEIPTNHTIYITFAPTVDDSLVPINFGGGIRKVVLCGLDSQIMPIVEDIRLNNCQLEKFVNGQWIAVGSVNDCITAITDDLQTQISSNDTDIANLDNRIGINESNITNLNTIVADHANLISTNQTQISSNDTDIANLQATAGQLQTQISSNDTDIADHETRITTLENAGSGGSGSGGGQNVKISGYSIPIGAQLSTSLSDVWENAITLNHQFTYKNAFIILELRCYTYPAGRHHYFRLGVDDSFSNLETWITDGQIQSAQVNGSFENIDTAQLSHIDLEFKTNVAGGGRISANQNIQVAIWEFSDIAELQETIVTFDNGGYPYFLPAGQEGVVMIGGFPDDCLRQDNLTSYGHIEVEIDLGAIETISNVKFNAWKVPGVSYSVYVDGNQEIGFAMNAYADNSWVEVDVNADDNTVFPLSGQVVRVRLTSTQSASLEARLDNIEVMVQ